MPIMRELAEELESTVVLLVREGEEVVGIAVAAPTKGTYHLAFRTGSRHPLGRGSAGICLLSALPARPGERPEVTRARAQGFAVSKGEVEPGAHGLAVLIHQGDRRPQRLPEPDHLPGRHHGRRRPGDAGRRRPDQRTAELTSPRCLTTARTASGGRLPRRPHRSHCAADGRMRKPTASKVLTLCAHCGSLIAFHKANSAQIPHWSES